MLRVLKSASYSKLSGGYRNSGFRLVRFLLFVFINTCLLTAWGVFDDIESTNHVYAVEVVNYQPGPKNDGNSIEPPHADPSLALGRPERKSGNNYVSLGFGGQIILRLEDLSSESSLVQLEIVASGSGESDCEGNPEMVEIYIGNDLSMDPSSWKPLGIACKGQKFDISDFEPFRLLYLKDISSPDDFSQGEDGYDLDGVVLTYCNNCSRPTSIPLPSDTPIPNIPTDTPTPFSITPEPIACLGNPLDVVLVMDRSSSMKGQSLNQAKQAAKSFVGLMRLQTDQIGLVSFSNSSQLDQYLTQDGNAVIQAIDDLKTSQGTNIAAGIADARTELISSRHNPLAEQLIILLSDGKQNIGDALLASQKAKQEGVRIITISLGEQSDKDMMLSIASSDADYYHAPNAADLLAIYQSIAETIKCTTITPSRTPTYTPSTTASITLTSSLTPTPSNTPTATSTASQTATATPSNTTTATHTASHTPTATPGNTMTATNIAPIAYGQSVVTTEDKAKNIRLTGSDADGNILTYTSSKRPLHGTLSKVGQNKVEYIPFDNYNGSDSFNFTVNDGISDSAPATVYITIEAINDAPVAIPDSYNGVEGQIIEIQAPGVLANDSDVDDGDKLTAIRVSNPSHGNLSLNPDGSFTYKPAPFYVGEDYFAYKINDGILDSNIATVNISLNEFNPTPQAYNQSVITDEDVAKFIKLAGFDAEGDRLTYTITVQPLYGDLDDNLPYVTYIPNKNYNGTDSFTFRVNDGVQDSELATISITIDAVNDAPLATDDGYSAREDETIKVSTRDGVLRNDIDIENDELTVVKVSNPSHGRVSLNLDGSFTYTPNSLYHGIDLFKYKINDGNLDSNIATVAIDVSSMDNSPICLPEVKRSTRAGEPVDLSTNCTDADEEPLTYTIVVTPAHGKIINATDKIVYVPDKDYSGLDSFSYIANDGNNTSNTVTVIIKTEAKSSQITGSDGFDIGFFVDAVQFLLYLLAVFETIAVLLVLYSSNPKNFQSLVRLLKEMPELCKILPIFFFPILDNKIQRYYYKARVVNIERGKELRRQLKQAEIEEDKTHYGQLNYDLYVNDQERKRLKEDCDQIRKQIREWRSK